MSPSKEQDATPILLLDACFSPEHLKFCAMDCNKHWKDLVEEIAILTASGLVFHFLPEPCHSHHHIKRGSSVINCQMDERQSKHHVDFKRNKPETFHVTSLMMTHRSTMYDANGTKL